LHLATAGVYTK
jgi:hypothetical protein